jgi:rubrerythrin
VVQKRQVNREKLAARARKRAAAKKTSSGSVKRPDPNSPARKGPKPDPEESSGRRPGPCPLCGARIAYDDEMRMNEHRFKGTVAVCAASDREYRWMPDTVEDGLPKRQRGGGPIPPQDLERMRRIVTQAVARHRDAKRTAARFAAQSETRRAATSRQAAKERRAASAPPEIIRCVSCGMAFERAGGESSRRCTICDPPRSTSVRAFRGGLPGLGQRS